MRLKCDGGTASLFINSDGIIICTVVDISLKDVALNERRRNTERRRCALESLTLRTSCAAQVSNSGAILFDQILQHGVKSAIG